MVQSDNIIWDICIACEITKATDINSEYVIIISLPLQHLLRDSA